MRDEAAFFSNDRIKCACIIFIKVNIIIRQLLDFLEIFFCEFFQALTHVDVIQVEFHVVQHSLKKVN